MYWSGRNKLGLKIIAVGLSFALAIPGFSSELKSARIYPAGKITIYSGGQRVGEFSKEAPVPEGFLIAADGRCGVRFEDLYLVAEDRSLFSVTTSANLRKLLIKKGTLYFAVSDMSRSLNFTTPFGTLAVLDILLNAATDRPHLKGYISIKQSGGEIGIIKGGSMIVSTQQGEMMIESGQQITLAQADMDVGAPEELEPSDEEEVKAEESVKDEETAIGKKAGMSKNTKIVLGAVGGAVVIGGIAALAAGGGGGGGSSGGNGGDDGDSVSRFSPTP
jgi:hypothetical protein